MINIGDILLKLWNESGFAALSAGFLDGGWQNLVMIAIACVFLYLGIVKKFEPLLLHRLRLSADQPAQLQPVPLRALDRFYERRDRLWYDPP